jgi:RimJ/RimL family protein N-acetyltransferase
MAGAANFGASASDDIAEARESVMATSLQQTLRRVGALLGPGDLSQQPDIVRLRDGRVMTLRFVEPDDATALQDYFHGLSVTSRYNRFLTAVGELPPSELQKTLHSGGNAFALLATLNAGDVDIIVGEARYALDVAAARVEFGLSIDDRLQGQGIGTVLLSNLQCRAMTLGATTIFGDTLRSNHAMQALARKAGFTFAALPSDWRLVRFEKPLDPTVEVPCAGWRAHGREVAVAAN